jgi:hypothetical protein
MKKLILGILVLLVLLIPAKAIAKIDATPVLVSSTDPCSPSPLNTATVTVPVICSSFVFDIPRIMTQLTLTVSKGGGWIVISTDAGEKVQYYVSPGAPYTPKFTSIYASVPSKFTKLASAVTFSMAAGTILTVTNIITQDRQPGSIAIQGSTSALIADGTVSNVLPDGFSFTVTSSGWMITIPPSTIETVIPVAIYDKDGNYLGTVNLTVPAVF